MHFRLSWITCSPRLPKYFGKRGGQVVQDNLTCVKRGFSEMREIPREVING